MRVSIVTISFNQSEFLERAIRSVIEQKYDDIEYIIVDPGSQDGSRNIIDGYRSRIARTLYEPDKGPADGLNKGFAMATGEIYGFLNSDDVLYPGAIERVVCYFKNHPEADVVSGHAVIIDEYDKPIRKVYSDKFSLIKYAYGSSVLAQQSTFFRANVFKQTNGFNILNRAAWDGELFVDMCANGAQFDLVDEFWSGFRLHTGSITSSKKLDNAIKQYRKEAFKEIIGRDEKSRDIFLKVAFRLIKHVRNPKGLYERLSKGKIYGRTAK